MTLKEVIEYLEQFPDQSQVWPVGFHRPHSYRGRYDCVAFEPIYHVSIADMLSSARSAIGAEYTGYHGGQYYMTDETEVYLARYGECSGKLNFAVLEVMRMAVNAIPTRTQGG